MPLWCDVICKLTRFQIRVRTIATTTPNIGMNTFASNLTVPPRRLKTWKKGVSDVPEVLKLLQKGPEVGFGAVSGFAVSAGDDTLLGAIPLVTVIVITTTSSDGLVAVAVTVFAGLVATGTVLLVGGALVFGGTLESVPVMPIFGSPDICLPTLPSNWPECTTFPGDWYWHTRYQVGFPFEKPCISISLSVPWLLG